MVKKYLVFLKNENFDKYKEQVNQENHIGLELLIAATIIVLLVNLAMRVALGKALLHTVTLYIQAVYFALVVFVYLTFIRKKAANFTFWIYLFEAPIMLISMFDAVYYEPKQTTFMFMIFMMVFPPMILDKAWRIILFGGQLAVIYAVIARIVEPDEIYYADMIHLVNVFLIGSGASIFFLIIRMRDIQYAVEMSDQAEEDPLTGIYNRAGGKKHVDAAKPGIFVYIDVDKFKHVNDQYGHEEGDRLLVETAAALQTNFRREDSIIRLGGDEFAVFAPGQWTYEQIERKLSELLKSIRAIRVAGDPHPITVSIGCAYAPKGCESADELMRVADQAMYHVKQNGKNDFYIETLSADTETGEKNR